MTDGAAVRVLLERVTALEAELLEVRREAAADRARAIHADRLLSEAEQRVQALESAVSTGRRRWSRP